MESSKRDQYHARAYERLLAKLGNPANVRTVGAFLATRERLNAALATKVNYVRAFVALEDYLEGGAYGHAAPDDVTGFFAALQREKKTATVSFYSKALLAFYRWSLGDEPMRRTFREAFRVPEAPGRTLIVTDDEFAAMVNACLGTQDRALVWLLRDSGIRLGEVYVANIDDVTFDDEGGVTLDLTNKDLKTKPSRRRIYMTRCVAILRALLAEHPRADDLHAPLFVHYKQPRRGRRIEHADLDGLIRRARMRSGVGKNITAHVFRHTRATELNRNGWPTQKINRIMGWSPTSRMNARYTHLNDNDVRERVRRDAGYVDPEPAPRGTAPVAPTAPTSEARAFAEAFGMAWRLARQGTSAEPPFASDETDEGDAPATAVVP